MDWLVLVRYVLVAAAVCFLPGLVVSMALRLRGLALAATSPVISVSIIAVSAIAASEIGMHWGALPVVMLTCVMVLIVVVLIFAARRFLPEFADTWFAASPRKPNQGRGQVAALCIALVAALTIATTQFVRMVVKPLFFSQTYDNVYHLNAIRWILHTRDGSSLSLSSLGVDGSPPSFYPAGWHDIVSLVNIVTGSPVIQYSNNAVIWLVMAVIWPLGCLFLVRQLLPQAGMILTITVGILSSSFAAFPLLMLLWGVLYPNFLGIALLPTALGLAVSVLRVIPNSRPPGSVLSMAALLLSLPGIILAHPNAFLTLIAVIAPIGLVWCIRVVRQTWQARRSQAVMVMGVTAAILTAFAITWRLARTGTFWQAINTPVASLGEFLLASPMGILEPFWVLGALIALGFVYMLLHAELRWWLGPVAVVGILWMAASALKDGWIRNVLVSGYYTDPHRLAAILPLALLPLAAMGVAQLGEWATNVVFRDYNGVRAVIVRVLAACSLWACLILGTQVWSSMHRMIEWGQAVHVLNDASPLVNSDEYALLQMIPDIVPSDTRVAVNPWTGGSMAFALEGVLTTHIHLLHTPSQSLVIVENSLDDVAAKSAYVCPAVKELNVGYVLDLGTHELTGGVHLFPGYDNLSQAPGFSVAAQIGDATLYRLDACG